MLIRDNFRRQFYDIIRYDHVLLLAGLDVDALCATYIFLKLFESDNVRYSLVTVTGWESLQREIQQQASHRRSMVLLNCGGNRALGDLNLPTHLKIFVIDSRRPFDIDNVFAEDNIRILIQNAELESLKFPKAEEIYASESESESSGEDDADEGRRTFEDIEKRALKRTRRQQWMKKRADVLWEYYQNSWYSVGCSILTLEIAHEVGKVTAELMWAAVVGLNSQFIDHLIPLESYTSTCIDYLRPFIRRFASRDPNVLKGDDQLKICFDKELPLPMYMHWSLFKSMINHDFFSCRTHFWQQRGESRMRSLLASMGLTITESEQMFCALNAERRKEVFDAVDKEMNAGYASFTAIIGFCNRFNACDFARALAGRLEVDRGDGKSAYDRFSYALRIIREFLSREKHAKISLLLKAIESYKESLQAITSQVYSSINQTLILPSGPFFLLAVPDVENARLLSSRHFLFTFTNFVLNAFCTASKTRSKSRATRPLITVVPLREGDEQEVRWYLITGCMPLGTEYTDSNFKSFIGRAFERVIERTRNCAFRRDSFDPNVIMVKAEDKSRFLDSLQAILETTV